MQNKQRSVMVYTLAKSASGDTEIVRTLATVHSVDDDLSNEVASAERKLTGKGYTCFGSFLESDHAAKLVNLDACKLVK